MISVTEQIRLRRGHLRDHLMINIYVPCTCFNHIFFWEKLLLYFAWRRDNVNNGHIWFCCFGNNSKEYQWCSLSNRISRLSNWKEIINPCFLKSDQLEIVLCWIAIKITSSNISFGILQLTSVAKNFSLSATSLKISVP